jgi:hypothetical protein
MLLEYEMSTHLAKKRFMSNYLLWHQHREVQPAVANESDKNDNVNRMDDVTPPVFTVEFFCTPQCIILEIYENKGNQTLFKLEFKFKPIPLFLKPSK